MLEKLPVTRLQSHRRCVHNHSAAVCAKHIESAARAEYKRSEAEGVLNQMKGAESIASALQIFESVWGPLPGNRLQNHVFRTIRSTL